MRGSLTDGHQARVCPNTDQEAKDMIRRSASVNPPEALLLTTLTVVPASLAGAEAVAAGLGSLA